MITKTQEDKIRFDFNIKFHNLNHLYERGFFIEKVKIVDRIADFFFARFRELEGEKKECQHDEWIDCPGGICTSDLHNQHCKNCSKHRQFFQPKEEHKEPWWSLEFDEKFGEDYSGKNSVGIKYIDAPESKLKSFICSVEEKARAGAEKDLNESMGEYIKGIEADAIERTKREVIEKAIEITKFNRFCGWSPHDPTLEHFSRGSKSTVDDIVAALEELMP